MMRFGVRWLGGLALALIAAAGLSCAHVNADNKDATLSKVDHESMMAKYYEGIERSKKIVVAKVNEADITLNQLINRMNKIAPDYIPHGQRSPEIDKKVKQDALDILIFRELAIQEAVSRGMKVPPKELDEALNKTRSNFGSEEAFNKSLVAAGETEESLKEELERNRLFEMIAAKEIFDKTKEEADPHSAEKRKLEWEADLKKNAKIEIFLDEVEKKLKEEAEKKKEK